MQRIMEHLLEDLSVIPFQNDIVITLKTEQEHINIVTDVLNMWKCQGIFAKLYWKL